MASSKQQAASSKQQAASSKQQAASSKQLNAVVSSFGSTAKAKLTNPAASGAPEDQLRSPFEKLLSDLAALCGHESGKVVAVGETSLSDLKIRPDYSITVHDALVGFVELKAPGKGANPVRFRDKHDKQQWGQLQNLPNLLYTDGNEFSLWRNGERAGDLVRLMGDVETSGAELQAPIELLALFSDFLRWEPQPPRSVKELAGLSARLCRLLRDEVIEQLEQNSQVFKGYAKDWRAMLFPEATDAKFADGYAQAVTFGLLMARAENVSLKDGFAPVIKALKGAGSLIGSAIELLVDENNQDSIKTSLATLRRVLEVVDWPTLSKGKPDAWLYFYEDFLDIYDKELRKQTGSYYTPPQVVTAMVRWIDEALRGDAYQLKQGLTAPQVSLIDPATGTGTYVLGVLRHIAAHVASEHGEGAVAGAIHQALERIAGFELQLGPYAVAQLRILAEVNALARPGQDSQKRPKSPRLFVTDTLSNPYDDGGQMAQMFAPIAESRKAANRIKRDNPVTVILGNPPYKEKAMGKGGFVESGDRARSVPPLLDDWQPPLALGASTHAKHLRNLYVYFWRWASWKVWDHGPGDKTGIVCFITVSGFLNGPGFQQMRAWLRDTCDEIYIVDCSPEGHQPGTSTRIFEGVQQPICIVLASRSSKANKDTLARVRFRALSAGDRHRKFQELESITLYGDGWVDCPEERYAPFLPASTGAWACFPKLEDFFAYDGSGVMAGRTWVIAPDAETLALRWDKLIATSPGAEQERLFHPHLRDGLPGDRHSNKTVKESLTGHEERLMAVSTDHDACVVPTRYAFRSFDRQWIIPDARLINQPNPKLWTTHSEKQIFLTAPHDRSPSSGPALSVSALIPDLHHYAGRGGRAFPLWDDAAAVRSNVRPKLVEVLTRYFKSPVSGEDVFAYIAGLTAHPAYTAKFQDDLSTPGLRIPMTADPRLFFQVAELGRRVIWLHSYGERMIDVTAHRPAGSPRVSPERRPTIPKEGMIPADMPLPEQIRYAEAEQRLYIGESYISRVKPAVWRYEVDGKHVIHQWFSYRKSDRSRPSMGDRRPPSPLQLIQPDEWLHGYTSDLLDLLNVLTLLVELEPEQAALLERVCDDELLDDAELRVRGAFAQDEEDELNKSQKAKRKRVKKAMGELF